MTLDEAIKIKQENREPLTPESLKKWEEADRLSIEALKRIQKDRQGTFSILLPGETEE